VQAMIAAADPVDIAVVFFAGEMGMVSASSTDA
jgi:hypothetical protein